MKTVFVRALFVLSCLVSLACAKPGGRSIVSLDADWQFLQGNADGAESVSFDDVAWETVDVPHDWSIAGPFLEDAPTGGPGGWLPSGVAWYRKKLELPADVAGKKIWIEFDGVMANSDVWLNGVLLGHRPSGYTSFRYDVSDAINPGDNILVVRADTSAQPASRWYTGAGIYRHVRMVVTEPLHIAPWGVYVTTPEVSEALATVQVQTELNNTALKSAAVKVVSILENPDGKIVATVQTSLTLDGASSQSVTQSVNLDFPLLWNLDSPNRYTLVSEVYADKALVDVVRTPFGIRSAVFTTDKGFVLNGERVKLKGVCLHHDGGAVGAAVPLDVWERRLKLLKELGVNAIRTAHNPPAPEFLDLCDRMGMLVMDEFFDVWRLGKRGADGINLHDYHLYFDEWAHTDLREGILRDRNHPSVILYSVGNEIHDTPRQEQAKNILRGLVDICHELDPSRPVTQGLFRPNQSHDYDNGLADMLDVIGTNYRDAELLKAWADKPGRKIVVTEMGYDRSSWLTMRDNPQMSGMFLWPGIDYLGESPQWPLTVFNNGLLDRCGFIMPRGRERQSWWSDEPMVAVFRRIAQTQETPVDPGYEVVEWKRRQVLFPDWNPDLMSAHEENVEVYSNAEEVELILNGKSLGRKKTRADDAAINWSVLYEPGTLQAIAYNGGEKVAVDTLRTAGEARQIKLIVDKKTTGLSWDDVVHVEVQMVDENGILVPTVGDTVTFSVKGPGKLIAVDSGNVVSTEPFQASERNAYQGRCLVILRAEGKGTVELTASVAGLKSASVKILAE